MTHLVEPPSSTINFIGDIYPLLSSVSEREQDEIPNDRVLHINGHSVDCSGVTFRVVGREDSTISVQEDVSKIVDVFDCPIRTN